MGFTIATAGKGGTGKTTFAALAVRALNEMGIRGVLAVDADPNSTLHEALGVEVERSVGEITEELMQANGQTPGGMSKDAWLELNINRYIAETPGFDLLSMGRPEGAGCYCYVNNLVRKCLDDLSRAYSYIVMDNEAGLEHLSRRTTRDVDVLLLVADPSVRGIRTAARLDELARELEIGVGLRALVVNRGQEPLDPVLQEAMAESGLTFLGVVPDDAGVVRCDLDGTGLFALPPDSPALQAVKTMLAGVVPTKANATA